MRDRLDMELEPTTDDVEMTDQISDKDEPLNDNLISDGENNDNDEQENEKESNEPVPEDCDANVGELVPPAVPSTETDGTPHPPQARDGSARFAEESCKAIRKACT